MEVLEATMLTNENISVTKLRVSVIKRPSIQYYPADWQQSKWIIYDYEQMSGWFELPKKPGCYVIYFDGMLGYVGQSHDVRKRFQTYNIRYGYGNNLITPWGEFKKILIKIRFSDQLGDWAMREIRLIARLQPKFNCVGSTKERRTHLVCNE